MKAIRSPIRVRKLTARSFRDFGWVIEYPGKNAKSRKVNLFRVVVKETRAKGWRIAYLILRDKAVKRLEQHPDSMESFEPVRGRSLLYAATGKKPGRIECFYLDKPVVFKKGVWHGIVTVTTECEVKITENAQVRCVYWPLGFKLGVLNNRKRGG